VLEAGLVAQLKQSRRLGLYFHSPVTSNADRNHYVSTHRKRFLWGCQVPGTVAEQSLLHGAVYSLEQCGRLLRDAALLYKNGSYATALTLAAFAREHLGCWKILLELRKRVLAGESLTVEDVRTASDDHVRKLRVGMTSLTVRSDSSSRVRKVLEARMEAPVGSKQRKEADQEVDGIDDRKWKRTPNDRHDLRIKALYVDILSEQRWNQPAREISQTAAFEFLVDATNDYELQRQRRYMLSPLMKSGDPELHEALAQWHDRPELPRGPQLAFPDAD
jgi:AbiV family abortive infection protein